MTSSNSFKIVVKFTQAFTGTLNIFLQQPAQIVETGTGVKTDYNYYPHKIKSS